MKIVTCMLLLLQLANFGAAQCVTGWEDKGGQCMKCSSAISGADDTSYSGAQDVCIANGGNLATIINRDQENFAFSCGTTSADPWFGFMQAPVETFIDGTPFVSYATITRAAAGATDCWKVDAVGTWLDQACVGPLPFVCSRPYETCYDLEVPATTTVTYAQTGSTTPDTGKRWVETTATYSCTEGYTISGGTSPRICSGGGSWTGSEPECVAAAVCSALTVPSDSTISYSTTASGSSYTTGTVATQVCNSGYDKKSGTDTRTCQSSGAWTDSAIVCEKDTTDALAIGLGVGLGVPAALGLAFLLFWMCRRTPAVPRPAPVPRPAAYPRPVFRPPYPRRMGPRPIF